MLVCLLFVFCCFFVVVVVVCLFFKPNYANILLFSIKDSIHRDFDVIWSECSLIDIVFLVLYLVSL